MECKVRTKLDVNIQNSTLRAARNSTSAKPTIQHSKLNIASGNHSTFKTQNSKFYNMLQYNVSLEGKTVLVTGAAGFIGSNLVKRLFHDVKNIKVIGIDSITDYYDVNIKYERLKEIEAIAENLIHE